MRRLLVLAATVLVSGMLGGCIPLLQLSDTALFIPAGSSSGTFTISNANPLSLPLRFSITPNQPWLNATPVSGESSGLGAPLTVTVSVDRSLISAENRTGALIIATNVGRFYLSVVVELSPLPSPEEGEVASTDGEGAVTEGEGILEGEGVVDGESST